MTNKIITTIMIAKKTHKERRPNPFVETQPHKKKKNINNNK